MNVCLSLLKRKMKYREEDSSQTFRESNFFCKTLFHQYFIVNATTFEKKEKDPEGFFLWLKLLLEMVHAHFPELIQYTFCECMSTKLASFAGSKINGC